MPQPRWTTDEELEWLMKWRPQWDQANTEKKRKAFYSEVEEAWFAWKPLLKTLYPGKEAADLNEEEKKMYQTELTKKKSQLQAWFRRLNTAGEPKSKSVNKKIHNLLDLVKSSVLKSSRAYQKLEVYQNQQAAKINQAVKDEWSLLGITSRSERMRVRRRVIKDLYEKESPDVIAAVEAAYKEQLEGDDEEEGVVDPTNATKIKSPEDFQRSIDAASYLIVKMIEVCAEDTDWTIDVMMGGMVPNRNGHPAVERYSAGRKTEAGHRFNEAYGKYHDNVYVLFSEFLWKVYPEDQRKARALPETGPKEDHRVELRDILKLDHLNQDPSSVAIAQPVNNSIIDDLDTLTAGVGLNLDDNGTPEQFSGRTMESRPRDLEINFDDDLEQFTSGSGTGNVNMREDVPEPSAPSTLPSTMDNVLDDYMLSPPSPVRDSEVATLENSAPPSAPPVLAQDLRYEGGLSQSSHGGPTEPIEEAFRRMSAESNKQQSHHHDSMIDPKLLNLSFGPTSLRATQTTDSSTTEYDGSASEERTENSQIELPSQPAKKKGRPGKKSKAKAQPDDDSANSMEGRRSTRKRAVATIGPKILVDPSQPPPKRAKPSWMYVPA